MDIAYIVFIFILLFLSCLYWKYPKRIYFLSSVWIVLIFIGLRSRVVGGADPINYVRFFTGEQNFYNINDPRDLEPLLVIYNNILKSILFSNGTLYLLVTTFIGLYFIYKMIDQYSYNKVLSILFFFLLIDYSLYFYALRQMLGLSFFLGGLLFILNHNKYKYKWVVYGVCCVVGYLMHTSVLFNVIVITSLYFISIKNKLYMYIAVVSSAMLGIIFQQLNFMDIFNVYSNFIEISALGRLEAYLYWDNVRDAKSIILLLRPALLSLVALFFIDDNKVNHIFTKAYIFSVVLGNILYAVPMVHRLLMGFSFYIIIVMTWILGKKYTHSIKMHRCINLLLLILILYFTRSYIITNSDYDIYSVIQMHPYYFFFEK